VTIIRFANCGNPADHLYFYAIVLRPQFACCFASSLFRPDRIPIGEVRGAEALDLLKAWGTGHPVGIGTIHAGSALGALRRLEQLVQKPWSPSRVR
jgi:Type II/IV secretion system protein